VGRVERVGVKQASERTDRVSEPDQLILVSPLFETGVGDEAEQEVRVLPSLEQSRRAPMKRANEPGAWKGKRPPGPPGLRAPSRRSTALREDCASTHGRHSMPSPSLASSVTANASGPARPWQAFVVSSLFGWQRADGLRRFSTAYGAVPRKNGKSTLSAGIALYLLVADGEQGAEIYSAATTRDQARIVFDEAKRMVGSSPALTRRRLENDQVIMSIGRSVTALPLPDHIVIVLDRTVLSVPIH
jgi:Phage Terminase